MVFMRLLFLCSPLQDIETKLRTLRLAEMYNSTQAQPQVPVTTSPWSKVKKKPRPNGGDATLDEEAGFMQTDVDGHDLYLEDQGVNLSPALAQQQHGTNHHNHHHHQPITATPMRRDRSLSPANHPIPPNAIPSSVQRSEQMPRSAPSSPQKNRHSNSAIYQQQQQYSNGYNHHHHHHQQQHSDIRRYLLFSIAVSSRWCLIS